MSKGSGFTRTVQYFRTASLEEAQACLVTCTSVVQTREVETEPKPRRPYTRRDKSNETAATAAAGGTE